MILRSSSTPVLGSLLSSFSDSPSNNNNNNSHHHQSVSKSPLHRHQIGCLNLAAISCNSSPISPSIAKGLRRAQSEGNLEGLAFSSSCNSNGNEDCQISSQSKKLSGRKKCLMLDSIPSFSLSNLRSRCEEDEEDEEEEYNGDDSEQRIKVAASTGVSNKMEKMVLGEQVAVMERSWNMGFEMERGFTSEEMHLAKGLGIDGGGTDGNGGGSGGGGGGGGNGGDNEFCWAGGDGGDMRGTDEYYKKMMQENPGNPLFLRNYAQFLYQTKRDLNGAEEYYSRAILADPKDGEILSQYANLVWELHRDLDKASSYFERAVQASPENSHVHAAYASFLWETEEDENECHVHVPRDFDAMPPQFQQGVMASTSA